MNSIRLRLFFRDPEFWLLLLLTPVTFLRPLFLGQTFFWRDLNLLFFSQRQRLAQMLTSGELPLWDANLHGGQPFLAEIVNTTLYPTNLLYLILPPVTAFNWEIAFHVALCAAGAYLLARAIGWSPVTAFIAGVLYGFCGYNLSLINILCRFLAMPYVPLTLLCWHVFLKEKKGGWFAAAALLASIQLLTGAFEMCAITWILLLLWGIGNSNLRVNPPRAIAMWFLLVLFGCGLAAIQLFPTWELAMASSRAEGVNYFAFTQWSLNPRRILELIVPSFLGRIRTINGEGYWGNSLEDTCCPYILSIYIGPITLILALAAACQSSRPLPIPRNLRRLLLTMTLAGAVLSMGRFLPFFRELYEYVPAIRIFRFPVKFLAAGLLPAVLLAAATMEMHFADEEFKPSKKWLLLWWIATAAALFFTLLYTFSGPVASAFHNLFFQYGAVSVMKEQLRNSFLHTSLVLLAVTLLYQQRTRRPRKWQHAALAIILTLDLLIAAAPVNLYAPRELFTQVPPIVNLIKQEIGSGRLYVSELLAEKKVSAPANELMWSSQWDRDVLRDYIAAAYDIPVVFHEDYDGLALHGIAVLSSRFQHIGWDQQIPMLSAAGVTLILTEQVIQHEGVQLIAQIDNRSDLRFFLYRNRLALSSPELIRPAVFTDSLQQAVSYSINPEFDPHKIVILEASPREKIACKETSAKVNVVARTSTESSYHVSTQCGGFLVLPETAVPGWKAEMDGTPAEILKANVAFSAIYIPPGEHSLARRYMPVTLYAGAACSTLSLLILLLLSRKQLIPFPPDANP